MKPDSKLAGKIGGKDFIITAEYLPITGTDASSIEACAKFFNGITAVNVADNHYGIALSSLAASVILSRAGIEPIFQLITRDRNRIALQSDLLGAAALGIKNVLCLTGYHQALIELPQAANVFDIDSIQLVQKVKQMNQGGLSDGRKIRGEFSMLIGAAANPNLKPLELNMLRLEKKANAGADFIQTQAIFDAGVFRQWLEAAKKEGITGKTAILAGVMPLASAAQGEELAAKHTDFNIPVNIIDRIKAAGAPEEQKKEGLKVASEIIKEIRSLPGLRGIHILSGGNESSVPELLKAI